MPIKLKKEELKNASGGSIEKTGPFFLYTCPNKECQKEFTLSEAKKDGINVYCPHCGTFVGLMPM